MTTLGDSGWGPMATLRELNAPRPPDLHYPPLSCGPFSANILKETCPLASIASLPISSLAHQSGLQQCVGGAPQKLFQEKSPLTSHLQAQGTLRVTLPMLPFS